MSKGTVLAGTLGLLTVALVAVGTIWPMPSAVYYAGGGHGHRSFATPVDAAESLGSDLNLRAWHQAYASLANKATFTEAEFVTDLTGRALSLRTYATLQGYEITPLHQSAQDAEVQMRLHWSSVVGVFDETRNLHVVRSDGRWAVEWPLVVEPHAPPQVIPVNYLRWDIVHGGSGDDWGTGEVESPHVRIVDLHPLQRAEGVVLMGELLNEDVIPAQVAVNATLLAKNGAPLATSGSFDMIAHTLLPKQVTPFLIRFPDTTLAQVGSLRMQPFSTLVAASADPVVEVQNQQFVPAPNPALTGQLSNQSGVDVNVAHVLSTFYDKNGQVIWVAGQYVDRALPPQTPVPFRIPVPADLGKQIATQRTVVATYVAGSAQ